MLEWLLGELRAWWRLERAVRRWRRALRREAAARTAARRAMGVGVVGLAVSASACGAMHAALGLEPAALAPRVRAPWHGLCQDGRPVKFLTGAACPSGICGFSCLPERWETL